MTRIIRIAQPDNFSFEECLWFLNRNFDDCLMEIGDNFVCKALKIGDDRALIRVSREGNALAVHVLDKEIDQNVVFALSAYVKEWFDMGRDIHPFYELLRKDADLAYMTDVYQGLRLVGINDLFEAVCWSIIGQQINLTFAYKLKRRLVEKYGSAIDYGEKKYYMFPEPTVLSELKEEDLRPLQFSGSKAKYLIAVAEAFSNGILSREKIESCEDLLSKQKILTGQKGIGIWTANYVLMKSLRESSSIPHGDVGLLQALQNHGIIHDRSEREKIDTLFSHYRGWESYLVFYLWRSLSSGQSTKK